MKKFGSYLKDKNVYEFYEEPLFYQSEYYSIYFQKAVEELGEKLDIKNILVTSAQEVAYAQFSKFFKAKSKYDVNERKRLVEEYFMRCGFGKINLKPIQAKGGNIEVQSEHYGLAWIRHFGKRKEDEPGVGYFAMGFLCGIIEAIFDVKPGTFDGKQLKCLAKGDPISKFEIYRGFRRKISVSPAMGKPHITSEEQKEYSSALIDSLVGLELGGSDSEDGLIHEFDQTMTLHYVNYFALASIKLLMQANKKLGPAGIKQAKSIITTTGEKNAYFLFGKIMNSDFWQKFLKENKDASGNGNMKNCMDVLTALGFGRWELVDGGKSQSKVEIYNCPETNAFLKLVGNSKMPIGFFNGGMLVGLANLFEKGATTDEGVDIEYVDRMAAANHFEFVEQQARMTGGDNDTLVVSRT